MNIKMESYAVKSLFVVEYRDAPTSEPRVVNDFFFEKQGGHLFRNITFLCVNMILL